MAKLSIKCFGIKTKVDPCFASTQLTDFGSLLLIDFVIKKLQILDEIKRIHWNQALADHGF